MILVAVSVVWQFLLLSIPRVCVVVREMDVECTVSLVVWIPNYGVEVQYNCSQTPTLVSSAKILGVFDFRCCSNLSRT